MRRLSVILLLLYGASGCHGGDSSGPRYTLTVIAGRGVSGDPLSGSVSSTQGSRVAYQFNAKPGYSKLKVAVDGATAAVSGTITMDADHTLYAEADSVIVPTAAQTTSVAQTRAVLSSDDPISSFIGLLNTRYAADRALSPSAAASDRAVVEALAFDRSRDAAALARVDAALDGHYFDLDFSSSSSTAAVENLQATGPLPITIYYMNGIIVSYDEALSAAITAKRLIEEIGLASYGWPRYRTNLVYLKNTEARGLESTLCYFLTGYRALALGLPPLSWYDLLSFTCGVVFDLARAIEDIGDLISQDIPFEAAKALADSITKQRQLGRGVLVIGHSRGTLVSQLAFREYFAASTDGASTNFSADRQKCVGFVSLAGPKPNSVGLRNVRNLYAEGSLTADILLPLAKKFDVTARGFRTNLSDDTDRQYPVVKSLLQETKATILTGLTLHSAINSYLVDAVMRDSVKAAIGREISSIQSECVPAAVSLSLVAQPQDGVSGDGLNPQPVVSVRDREGFRIGSSSAPVTVSLIGSGGTLSGTRTVNASDGAAAFSDLRVTGAGFFRLSFSSPGLPSVVSNGFTIAASSCSGTTLGIPFSVNGAITSSSCIVNNRRAQTYRFDLTAQGTRLLSVTSPSFAPFVKVWETGGQGNYTVWTSGNSLNVRWLLSAGSYATAVGTNSGQVGTFSFSGSQVPETNDACTYSYLLQPTLLRTSQRIAAGDCTSDGIPYDAYSMGGTAACTITVQSSAFNPVIDVFAQNGSRITVGNAGTTSQARVRLPVCYAGSDSEFVFGVRVLVSSTDPGRMGSYTLTVEFDQQASVSAGTKTVLLGGNDASVKPLK